MVFGSVADVGVEELGKMEQNGDGGALVFDLRSGNAIGIGAKSTRLTFGMGFNAGPAIGSRAHALWVELAQVALAELVFLDGAAFTRFT